MKALVCEHFGALDGLGLKSQPEPRPGPGQLLIRVAAVSLNFPDALICQGLYQVKPALPFSPGAELAGEIVALGEGVAGWTIGQRVLGSVGYGALAEFCIADAWRMVPLPDSVPFETASTLVVAYGTVLHALRDCVDTKPGQTLLVTGASGGVGTAAIQLGRAFGLNVIAAVSSMAKANYCRTQGADQVVLYNDPETLKAQIMALTNDRGVDVVLDPVGGAIGFQAFRSLVWRGCYLVLGFAAGEISRYPLNLALLKERRIQGVYWGEAVRRDPAAYRRIVAQLCEWAAQGVISPVISARVSLEQSVNALHNIVNRDVLGKIVVTLND